LAYVSSLGPEAPGSYGLLGSNKFTLEPFDPDNDGRNYAEHKACWASTLTRDLPAAWPEQVHCHAGATVHIYTSFEPESAADDHPSLCLQAIQPGLDANVRFTCDDGPDTNDDMTVEQWQLSRLMFKLHHKYLVQSDHLLELTPAEYSNLYRLKSILYETLLAFKNLPPSAHLTDKSTIQVDETSYLVSHLAFVWLSLVFVCP
jgi:hypothetical protein